VISNKSFNQQHNQLILAMITATTDNVWLCDVSLTNWQTAGPKTASRFRLKLFTLDQNLVVRAVGRLSSKDVKAVQLIRAKFIDIG